MTNTLDINKYDIVNNKIGSAKLSLNDPRLYFISIGNIEVSKNLFGGLNLSEYYNYSFKQYTFIVSYKIVLYTTEVYIAYLIIQLLNKLNLEKPLLISKFR